MQHVISCLFQRWKRFTKRHTGTAKLTRCRHYKYYFSDWTLCGWITKKCFHLLEFLPNMRCVELKWILIPRKVWATDRFFRQPETFFKEKNDDQIKKVYWKLDNWRMQCKGFHWLSHHVTLWYLSVSTRAVIGQFIGPYSTVRPTKFKNLFFEPRDKYLTNFVFSVRTVS